MSSQQVALSARMKGCACSEAPCGRQWGGATMVQLKAQNSVEHSKVTWFEHALPKDVSLGLELGLMTVHVTARS